MISYLYQGPFNQSHVDQVVASLSGKTYTTMYDPREMHAQLVRGVEISTNIITQATVTYTETAPNSGLFTQTADTTEVTVEVANLLPVQAVPNPTPIEHVYSPSVSLTGDYNITVSGRQELPWLQIDSIVSQLLNTTGQPQ